MFKTWKPVVPVATYLKARQGIEESVKKVDPTLSEDDVIDSFIDEANKYIAGQKDFRFEELKFRKNEKNRYYYMAKDPGRLEMVRLLISSSVRQHTIIHNSYTDRIPLEYEFPGGVMIEFLPHWENHYTVELVKMMLPKDVNVLFADVEEAKLGRSALERYAKRNERQYTGREY